MFARAGMVDGGAAALPDDPRADDWWGPDALAELEGPAVPTCDARVADEGAGDGGVGLGFAGLSSDPEEFDWWLAGAQGGEAGELVDEAARLALVCAPLDPATYLERAVPGGELAAMLELVDLAALDDATLVEAVAAWERQAAWAHLGAALAAGELSRRAAMNPDWGRPIPTRTCVAGDELAMRLGWSRPAATRLVRDGRALANELLLVADAVRAGQVDTPKLRVLTDRLADRPGQLAWAVQEAVLPAAATRTPTQLACDVDRALLVAEPEDAAFRLPAAIAARHVCHPRRLPDGMAGLWAVLPAVDAARIDATLEATARAARAGGDARTLDQLRADTLVDLATGDALLAGAPVTGSPTSSRGGTSDHAPKTTDRPTAAGTTAVDDAAGRGQAGDAAGEVDLDPGTGGGAGRPLGRAAPGIRIPTVRIDVTVALSTLLGVDELPGELAGLGPIPAEQARALAAGGTWRRIVTDPLTGTVLDVGRTRYRPPASLAAHVVARDGQCAAPGCTVPAHRCDLDHTTDYHATPANGSRERGTTSAGNLGPLSARCHRLKTDGGFTLRQVAPGVFEWRTPAGLAYRVIPGDVGRTQRLGRSAGYPDEPPF